uniref:Uncharacterized protein n=1 Tax=Tetraselmis chuii TaxID=63592 RepID=A0A7S1XBJ9_9CHLO|mmetsp:Transcript_7299/g.13191  ORF Transcript_7299/g.13191 Transcript_7299/m.13191 type:complete len:428 (+) Transcript_7299:144-1427(+)
MSIAVGDEPDIPQAKEVGRGLDAPAYNPRDPQGYLEGSNHPYAPFTGNAYKWGSYVYDDGTTYEGLLRDDVPHVKGTIVMGNGPGGGFQEFDKGDVYEGELEAGFAHGLGQYNGAKGEIYRGEFSRGMRSGCGMLMNVRPYLNRIKKGESPASAWAATKAKIEDNALYGTWQSDLYLTGPSEDPSFCHIEEIRGVLQELDSVITRTRMFRHKPDGDVLPMTTAHDARGIPINMMLDPLHYPHGTGFLAPGPMGQTHPLPDDPTLKAAMEKTHRNFMRIWNSYNFEREATPGSDLDKAEKLGKEIEEQREKAIAEMMAAEKRRLRRLERIKTAGEDGETVSVQVTDKPEKEESAGAEVVEEEEEGEDDDLTVASVDTTPRRSGFNGPTAFASISLGMSRAQNVIGNVLSRAAQRAPRRPRLVRPSDLL